MKREKTSDYYTNIRILGNIGTEILLKKSSTLSLNGLIDKKN